MVSADDEGARELTALVRGRRGLRVLTVGQAADADVHITAVKD
ncbi:hypothetical protein [Streptomyces sp. NPDC001404]